MIDCDNALWDILHLPWASRVKGCVWLESISQKLCPLRAEVAGPSSPVLESNQLSITEGREREGEDSLALDLITLVTLAV